MSLNPSSPLPLYLQLADELRAQIQTGIWPATGLLPSEAELGQLHEVSRTVVRQALDELERSGLIRRVKGKGSYVAERKLAAYLMQDVAGFSANMIAQGRAVRSVVLKQGVIPAPPAIAKALQLHDAAPVLRLERLRFVDGEPIYLGVTFIPDPLAAAIHAADFASVSLNAAFADHAGVAPAAGERLIEAVAAGRREAELLRVRVGAPLFHLFAVTRDRTGAALECSEVWLRGDRIAFRVALATPLPSHAIEAAVP